MALFYSFLELRKREFFILQLWLLKKFKKGSISRFYELEMESETHLPKIKKQFKLLVESLSLIFFYLLRELNRNCNSYEFPNYFSTCFQVIAYHTMWTDTRILAYRRVQIRDSGALLCQHILTKVNLSLKISSILVNKTDEKQTL